VGAAEPVKGRGSRPRRAGPEEKLAGNFGGHCTRGRKGERGKKKGADRWGPAVKERERGRARGVAGLRGKLGRGRGPRGEKRGRERPEGGNGPGEERAREGERERGKWAGLREFGLVSFPILFLFFSILKHPNKII
jgi:hypothetical protein